MQVVKKGKTNNFAVGEEDDDKEDLVQQVEVEEEDDDLGTKNNISVSFSCSL